MAQSSTPSPRRGASLAKGPIGLIGLAGIVYGVLALVFGGNGFGLRIPHRAVGTGHFLGLLTNGWTDLLFVAAGLLLVLASRGHWTARAASLIVAFVLGAAAIVAVVRGDGVFGLFAANHRTEIVWAVAAVVLLALSRLPRLRGRDEPPSTNRPATVRDGGGDDGGSLVSSR